MQKSQNVYVVVNKNDGEIATSKTTFNRQDARDLKNSLARTKHVDTRSFKIMKYAPVGSVR